MRPCASCDFGPELDRQLRAGVPLTVLSAWTAAQGSPITRQALGRHRRDHLGTLTRPGRKPASEDFLEAVVDDAAARLSAGEIRASLRDGIAARKALDARDARGQDRDLMVKIAMVLTGNVPLPTHTIDPEVEAIEAEYRALLEPGD
jgi:hypothetical protein